MNGQGKDEAQPDVIVVLEKDGRIINGSGGVLQGTKSDLGIGKLGYMTLGT